MFSPWSIVHRLSSVLICLILLTACTPAGRRGKPVERGDAVVTNLSYQDRIVALVRAEGLSDAEEKIVLDAARGALSVDDLVRPQAERIAGPVGRQALRERAVAEGIRAFVLIDANMTGKPGNFILALDGKMIFPDMADPAWEHKLQMTNSDVRSGVIFKSKPEPRTREELARDGAAALMADLAERRIKPLRKSKARAGVYALYKLRDEVAGMPAADEADTHLMLGTGFLKGAETAFEQGLYSESAEFSAAGKKSFESARAINAETLNKAGYSREKIEVLLVDLQKQLDRLPMEQLTPAQRRTIIDLQAELRHLHASKEIKPAQAIARAQAADEMITTMRAGVKARFDERVKRIKEKLLDLKEWDAPLYERKTWLAIEARFNAAIDAVERGDYEDASVNLRQAEESAQMTLEFLFGYVTEHAQENYIRNRNRVEQLIGKIEGLEAGGPPSRMDTDTALRRVGSRAADYRAKLAAIEAQYDSGQLRPAAVEVAELFRMAVLSLRDEQDRRVGESAAVKRKRDAAGKIYERLDARKAGSFFPDTWTQARVDWARLKDLEGDALVTAHADISALARTLDALEHELDARVEKPLAEADRIIRELKASGKPWAEQERKRKLAEIYIREGLIDAGLELIKEIQ